MRLPRPLSLLIIVLSLGLAATAARAASATDPQAFINALVTEALQTLNAEQLPPEEREQRFRALLHEEFDMPRISRFVLGRYWTPASEQERQQFAALFEEYIIRAYSQRFSEYHGELVKVTGSRPENETSTVVTSQIVRPNGAPPVKLDWRVRKEESLFKIVDVDVEGVSMLLTQREEFAAVIQRNGGTVAGLNEALQQKLVRGETALAPAAPKQQ